MPIRMSVWKVGPKPQALSRARLADEKLLEDMIVAAPELLSDEWMLIGRQIDTGLGGRVDLLAIAPDASLVVIELKKGRTPRDVVAQTLDYAGWAERLRADEIAAIYAGFSAGRNLADDFLARFSCPLQEETLNQDQQLVIVAADVDESTERIVRFLNERDIPLNILFFQVFALGADKFITRVWLLDPIHGPDIKKPTGVTERWNGEFYVSFGEDNTRSWADAVEFGFVCGGGSPWYSSSLHLLSPGDRIWVKVPGAGFVGVGRVTGTAQPASDFRVVSGGMEQPVLHVAKRGHYHKDVAEDEDRCEYFVPVKWLQTVPTSKAFQDVGLFGNQNTVCRPTTPKWRSTVEALKREFPDFDKS